MNRLERGTTRSESDDLLRMTLLLAIWECHSHLTWGSRNREPVSSAEHSKPLRYVPLTPPQLRKMTRTAASLAGLDEGGPRRGQFELVVETQTVTIDVEITGDPHDRVVILSWGDALPARDAAGRVLRRVLELPPAPICYPVDEEDEPPAGRREKPYWSQVALRPGMSWWVSSSSRWACRFCRSRFWQTNTTVRGSFLPSSGTSSSTSDHAAGHSSRETDASCSNIWADRSSFHWMNQSSRLVLTNWIRSAKLVHCSRGA